MIRLYTVKEKDRFLTNDGQWCFVTINIKQEGDEIVKKEELRMC